MANKVTVEEEVCKGCGLCVMVCPKGIMAIHHSKLNDKGYSPAYCEDMGKCIACAMCGVICPDSAITVEKE